MDKQKMEKELKQVITGLADAFENEAKQDYLKNHKKAEYIILFIVFCIYSPIYQNSITKKED